MASGSKTPEQNALVTLRSGLDALESILPTLGAAASGRTQSQLDEATRTLLQLRADLPKAPRALINLMTDLLPLLTKTSLGLKPKAIKDIKNKLTELGNLLALEIDKLDQIRTPCSIFDPTAPSTIARLVAIALLAQQRLPLANVGQMYGSGCYAIYYVGGHPAYELISKTETPVYIGKADPEQNEANNPQEQGPRLTGRLRDHCRMIRQAQQWAEDYISTDNPPIRIEEFEYRRIVVATNAQLAAEQYLINFFKPIWNKECKVCWGISKHGDSATTRSNSRSPWDVIHPGRRWAMDSTLQNSKDRELILHSIEEHFKKYPPYQDVSTILNIFMLEFKQTPVELGGIGAPEEETEE
ncbi:MAG: Eco29kI family restriction endonuclease [Candidatus Riflebacteria bacterium]|nr:Eco29kI family restriction endonuclease [Candidatus Riflebacteria bacterium]